MMSPPLTTSMTGPETTSSFSFFCSIVPHARSYCARFFDRIRRPSLSSFGEDERFDLFAERHDLVRVDVVANREFLARDDALGLVADVEQHFVRVDLHDLAVHEISVVERDDGRVDGVGERHAAEVVDDDVLLHLGFGFVFRRRVVRTHFGFGGGGLGDCSGRRHSRVRFLIQHLIPALFGNDGRRDNSWAGRAPIAAPVERLDKATRRMAPSKLPLYGSTSGRCASSKCSGTSIDGAVRAYRPGCTPKTSSTTSPARAATSRSSRGRVTRRPEVEGLFATVGITHDGVLVVDPVSRVERLVGFEMPHDEVRRERTQREASARAQRGGEAGNDVELGVTTAQKPEPALAHADHGIELVREVERPHVGLEELGGQVAGFGAREFDELG